MSDPRRSSRIESDEVDANVNTIVSMEIAAAR
jgi:hypothetical protein